MRLLLLAPLLLTCTSLVRCQQVWSVRVPDDDAASAPMLESLKAEGVLETWKTGPRGGESLFLVHELQAAAAALGEAGLEHQVFIDDVEKLVEEQKEGIRWKASPGKCRMSSRPCCYFCCCCSCDCYIVAVAASPPVVVVAAGIAAAVVVVLDMVVVVAAAIAVLVVLVLDIVVAVAAIAAAAAASSAAVTSPKT